MQSTVAILICLQALILLSLWGILYRVVGQQGRILLRLGSLGQRLRPTEPESRGLAIGKSITPFSLPDLDGHTIALDELRGRRVLLIFWGPECRFCELLAPELARLQGELRVANVQLVLVSLRDAASNRRLAEAAGLRCPILLMTKEHPLIEDAFRYMGTPSAYLLDEEGRVAKSLGVGRDPIVALAREAVISKRLDASPKGSASSFPSCSSGAGIFREILEASLFLWASSSQRMV